MFKTLQLKSFIQDKALLNKIASRSLVVIALIVIVNQLAHSHSGNQVGKVNITGIVNQFIQSQVKLNEPTDKRKQHIKAFGHHLDQVLQVVAENEHVVLLPSEAVISGAKDYTQIVQKQLLASTPDE